MSSARDGTERNSHPQAINAWNDLRNMLMEKTFPILRIGQRCWRRTTTLSSGEGVIENIGFRRDCS
jgi:hypothetical protein